jgi:hypothetical protein
VLPHPAALLPSPGAPEEVAMSRQVVGALYVLVMVAVVVSVDLVFFRHQFWPRLAVNVGIVLVFGAFYFRFLKHS